MLRDEQILIIIVGLVTSGLFAYKTFQYFRKKRKVEDSHRSNIATAPQGYVEIEGFVWPVDRTFIGQSGYELVYYSFQLQKLVTRGSGKSRRQEWVTVFNRTVDLPFYIVDGTGLAQVIVNQAELNLGTQVTCHWRKLNDSEQKRILQNVLTEAVPGFPPAPMFWGMFGQNFRVVEKEIRTGAPIYAHGDFKTFETSKHKTTVPGLTDFFNRVFHSQTGKIKNLGGMFDINGDGNVNAKEARNGYTMGAKMARTKAQKLANSEKIFPVCGHLMGSVNHHLYIADMHEKYLRKHLDYYFWGYALATIVSGSITIVIIGKIFS